MANLFSGMCHSLRCLQLVLEGVSVANANDIAVSLLFYSCFWLHCLSMHLYTVKTEKRNLHTLLNCKMCAEIVVFM